MSGTRHASVLARRVLVVDDERHQAAALAALLRLEGVAAMSEHVATAALARALIEPPDAIVLNVKMPGLSGTELLAAVRERYPDLPILLVTGYDAQDPRLVRALTARRVWYLAKPVALPSVIEMLAGAFADHGSPEAVPRSGV
jgi:DNA-binding NtrC family response regulator